VSRRGHAHHCTRASWHCSGPCICLGVVVGTARFAAATACRCSSVQHAWPCLPLAVSARHQAALLPHPHTPPCCNNAAVFLLHKLDCQSNCRPAITSGPHSLVGVSLTQACAVACAPLLCCQPSLLRLCRPALQAHCASLQLHDRPLSCCLQNGTH
jgi:hypothetical protein